MQVSVSAFTCYSGLHRNKGTEISGAPPHTAPRISNQLPFKTEKGEHRLSCATRFFFPPAFIGWPALFVHHLRYM
jgi:hypothetical protein